MKFVYKKRADFMFLIEARFRFQTSVDAWWLASLLHALSLVSAFALLEVHRNRQSSPGEVSILAVLVAYFALRFAYALRLVAALRLVV